MNRYSELLSSIRSKLEEQRARFRIGIHNWSILREFLEFLNWCLSNAECSQYLSELVNYYRDKFILERGPEPYRIAYTQALLKITSTTREDKPRLPEPETTKVSESCLSCLNPTVWV